MGRVADTLAKIRTPEKLEAAAKALEQIKALSSSGPSAAAGAPTAQVFHEPFFQTLKGQGQLGQMGWFQNYHAKYFVPGRLGPLTHLCLFLGVVGYAMDYTFHLQYERHGVRDAHKH